MPIELNKIYEQDCKSLHYQDNVRWSRFQTATAVEAGVVYAVWGGHNIGPWNTLSITILGFGLIVMLLWLSQIDERDYAGHLDRIKKLEKDQSERDPSNAANPKYPYESPSLRWFLPKTVTGSSLMVAASLILVLFNLLLMFNALRSVVASVCPHVPS